MTVRDHVLKSVRQRPDHPFALDWLREVITRRKRVTRPMLKAQCTKLVNEGLLELLWERGRVVVYKLTKKGAK